MNYKTEQENFWATDFGSNYIDRNNSSRLLDSKVFMWTKILKSVSKINSIRELGCNIGLNLVALKRLNPNLDLFGYEINDKAVQQASQYNVAKITKASILEKIDDNPTDLVFTCTVLIHINPNYLSKVYDNLYHGSNKYILIAEYYNPTPTKIDYRGHSNKLFKRDFAGELIDEYSLKLVDYGFIYKRDNWAPQDDINWFLLEK